MSDHYVLLYCCMSQGCVKTYNTKFNLKRHVDSKHLRLTRYMCETCSHEFSSKQNLVEHRYLHTGKKPFVCEQCSMAFRQASQLSLHKREHVVLRDTEKFECELVDAERPFPCLPTVRDVLMRRETDSSSNH